LQQWKLLILIIKNPASRRHKDVTAESDR